MSHQIAEAARRATCPACGATGARAIILAASRPFIDLDCQCGQRYRVDRATGRLVTRLRFDAP